MIRKVLLNGKLKAGGREAKMHVADRFTQHADFDNPVQP